MGRGGAAGVEAEETAENAKIDEQIGQLSLFPDDNENKDDKK